jgi:hypothetical protein
MEDLMHVSEIGPLKEAAVSAIEIDPTKRYVLVIPYGIPRLYLKMLEERWKEITGSAPIILMRRPGMDDYKIFEVEQGSVVSHK